MEETKECSRCGREMPLSSYKKIGKRGGGYTFATICGDCLKEAQKKGRENKKKEKEKEIADKESEIKKLRLKDFTPRELLEELKYRGYKWERMFVVIEQEIDYNKI